MDKKVFNMIKEYADKVDELYFKLEEEFETNKAEKLVGDLDRLQYKFLGFEENEDFNKYFEQEPKYLTEVYEDAPKYLMLYVIREYENEMVLCISTSDSFYLIPKSLLADYDF
jgi:hypothetical protein